MWYTVCRKRFRPGFCHLGNQSSHFQANSFSWKLRSISLNNEKELNWNLCGHLRQLRDAKVPPGDVRATGPVGAAVGTRLNLYISQLNICICISVFRKNDCNSDLGQNGMLHYSFEVIFISSFLRLSLFLKLSSLLRSISFLRSSSLLRLSSLLKLRWYQIWLI